MKNYMLLPKDAIRTEITINGSASEVWSVLTNFSEYPDWNPFVKSLTGEVAVGRQIAINLSPPNGQEMKFKPVVKAFEPNVRFRWLGNVGVPGLFDGEHSFELVAIGSNQCQLIHSERFRGLLVPFMKTMIHTTTVDGFNAMNEALKQRVESGASASS